MTLVLAPHVTIAEVPEGAVLLDETTGRYWQLNDTGALALRRMLDGQSAEDAVAALRREYPDAGEQVAHDVRALLTALRTAKLVVA